MHIISEFFNMFPPKKKKKEIVRRNKYQDNVNIN